MHFLKREPLTQTRQAKAAKLQASAVNRKKKKITAGPPSELALPMVKNTSTHYGGNTKSGQIPGR
jgi:hypothetical protein